MGEGGATGAPGGAQDGGLTGHAGVLRFCQEDRRRFWVESMRETSSGNKEVVLT